MLVDFDWKKRMQGKCAYNIDIWHDNGPGRLFSDTDEHEHQHTDYNITEYVRRCI